MHPVLVVCQNRQNNKVVITSKTLRFISLNIHPEGIPKISANVLHKKSYSSQREENKDKNVGNIYAKLLLSCIFAKETCNFAGVFLF